MVLSSRAIDKERGSNDDHLPALTLAVTIYFKGLGHDINFPLFVSENSIDRVIKKIHFTINMNRNIFL